MLDGEPLDDPLSLKEIKVRIPVSFHLKLHAFKVLKGKPISDTIVEALDAYFKAAEARKAAHGEGAPLAGEPGPPQALEGAGALQGQHPGQGPRVLP
jgi:hypothetical protein